MAEQEPTAEQLAQIAAENEEDEHSVNYKPPAQKSIQEIQELDKDDESLRKYKEALLGRVAVSADPNVANVIVTRLTLVCSTAPGPLELDLTGDLESFKKQSFVLKEGVEYRIKISFRVNREIVSGMKYIQHTYRKGVKSSVPLHRAGPSPSQDTAGPSANLWRAVSCASPFLPACRSLALLFLSDREIKVPPLEPCCLLLGGGGEFVPLGHSCHSVRQCRVQGY
ncbi:rho GDP-dissociation inhibitor 1 isoform X1 [Erinaceus europaeus]|uniref:Rho GDP-dissociation inhibitor 1 n=1 Tax=Erinaceus europaeus TaxID=9365 RepID=A0ABM3VTT6_ERIEU|nr:rho GDP-dissociation inhibitor 1 isoform X1 [Erinaceus europaeus]XP_060027739.1 rho GDP-dissociation inhibitor 1 isoform X1 [Erinaceus europaeus]